MHSIYKIYQNNVYRFDYENDKYPSRSFEWNLIYCLNWEWGWVEELNQNYIVSYPYNHGKEISEEEASERNRKIARVKCSICKKDIGDVYKGHEDLIGFYESPLCPNCYVKMQEVFISGKRVCDVCRFAGKIAMASRESKSGHKCMGIYNVCEKHYIEELEEKIEKINKKWWKKILFID